MVTLAACDTFRSGAVEQLRTHARRLGVPLYERGYGKDPAGVAEEAIAQAGREGQDVVLVDTAGRMQDNEPLMRALAKLVDTNRPDLVLFVGEEEAPSEDSGSEGKAKGVAAAASAAAPAPPSTIRLSGCTSLCTIPMLWQ